jgi:hypothetical protein
MSASARIFATSSGASPCPVGESLDPLVILAGELLKEVLSESRDVAGAQPKRRHLDVNDVEPIIEIFAEAACLDVRGEVTIRRRETP